MGRRWAKSSATTVVPVVEPEPVGAATYRAVARLYASNLHGDASPAAFWQPGDPGITNFSPVANPPQVFARPSSLLGGASPVPYPASSALPSPESPPALPSTMAQLLYNMGSG